MNLKESDKRRVNFEDIEFGEYDHDGNSLILFNGHLYTGYVILDKYPNGDTMAEMEYDSGSRVGWQNEYNEAGILIYSCYSVGQTTKEVYEYDDEGNLIDHYEL
ncbi:hypothetical protein [Chryseobacterium sp. SIMBA_028]|uniref:hypothetical protein n=1 Tax=Chryseobacterium sp. SIMBA_028 TaxID=3085771 RepID=UPI003979B626